MAETNQMWIPAFELFGEQVLAPSRFIPPPPPAKRTLNFVPCKSSLTALLCDPRLSIF